MNLRIKHKAVNDITKENNKDYVKVGNIFHSNWEDLILARVSGDKCVMIGLVSGNRFSDMNIPVNCYEEIEFLKLQLMFPSITLTKKKNK